MTIGIGILRLGIIVSGGENPRKDGGSIVRVKALVATRWWRPGDRGLGIRMAGCGGEISGRSRPGWHAGSLSGPALVWLPLTGWGRPSAGVTGRVGIFGEV